MKPKKENPVSEKKKKTVQELENLFENKKTTLVASIKNIPASQFQDISKKLRGKALIKVLKKNLVFRAIDSSKNEEVKKLKEKIDKDVAILFSDIECFELSGELVRNKCPAKAKTGQEAPEDIEVQAGPTDLPPGPAISQLSEVGLRVKIDKGKISIQEPKTIIKKGEKISSAVAEVMNKLDITPFSVGFTPLIAFDNQEKKLYTEIKIDPEKTIAEIKNAFGKALPFAVSIGHANKDTITFLIGKAKAHEKALGKLEAKKETNEEQKPEEKESNQEENQNKEIEEVAGEKQDNAQENKNKEEK